MVVDYFCVSLILFQEIVPDDISRDPSAEIKIKIPKFSIFDPKKEQIAQISNFDTASSFLIFLWIGYD